MVYPDTRVDAHLEDTLAGVSFHDPYRWLEADNEEVRNWQRAQAQLASAHVREWCPYDRLRELVSRFNINARVSMPRYAGGRWFRTHVPEGASQAQVIVSDTPMGSGCLLFDPRAACLNRPPFVSWISPAPDGATVAIGLCADGSENNTIRLIDVASGRLLPDPPREILMDNWTGGAQWLPDSSGFFFSAITGSPIEFAQHVYLHRRLPRPSTDQAAIPWTEAKDWRMAVVSQDGRHAIAIERLRNPIPVAIAALGKTAITWRPFITSVTGTVAGHVIGERYIAVTDVGASRGRLVAIPLDARDPNDPRHWHELVPESDAVMCTVTAVGDRHYVSELLETYARVRVFDSEGNELGEVPLPGRGAVTELPFPIMNLVPRGHPQKFLFGFSSLTESPGIYSHTPDKARTETLQSPRARLENAIVDDCWARSADGTLVPYHIVRCARAPTNRPQPTLLYAYGGFNVPFVPQFPGPMAAFVAAGGLFVHAHLRGGGELGLEWWQNGRMQKKQRCFEDLYAVAEDLIAKGYCTPQTLAVTGSSNGGLMAGVAMTQRPELWKVVVPRVPLLDLIGACREPYGRMAVTMEYANVDGADDVKRLASFSPYQLVRSGVAYPAVYIDAGDTDPRCPPWHARKFAARLQQATGGDAPILLHVWENVGHGWATDKSTALTEYTEWLAFVLLHLGVKTLPDI